MFGWEGTVPSQETASSDSRWQEVGATWEDTWDVGSNCVADVICAAATVNGTINGIAFTAVLALGPTYTGVAAIDDYWLDCHDRSSYEDTALSIQLTVTQETFAGEYLDRHRVRRHADLERPRPPGRLRLAPFTKCG